MAKRYVFADFGLARMMKEEMAATVPEQESGDDIALAPTRTIGFTPAYAAPEQMTGRIVDEHTDQYAFCVALFEALVGELPFAGETLPELVTNKSQGHFVPFVQRSVPSRIMDALRRGMDPDPAKRHPSMKALLKILQPRPSWGVGVVVALSVVASTATATTLFGAPEVAPRPLCEGYEPLVQEQWNEGVQEEIRSAFERTGEPRANAAASTVILDLDSFHRHWQSEALDACRARVPVESLGTLVRTPESERSRCLEIRRHEVARLIDTVRHVEPKMVDQPFGVTGIERSLQDCQGREPIPINVSDEDLDQLDDALASVNIALGLRDWEGARVGAEEARMNARRLGLVHRELEAEIDLGRAQLELQPDRGQVILEGAGERAEVLLDDRHAWQAWVNVAQLGFEDSSRHDAVLEWLARARTASNRMPGDEYRKFRLLFERASLETGMNDAKAIALLEEVWSWLLRQDGGQEDLKIATGQALAKRLLQSGKGKEAVRYARVSMDLAERRRGAGHPDTAMARLNIGIGLIDECELGDARTHLAEAEVSMRELGPEYAGDRLRVLLALAQLNALRGHYDEVQRYVAQAVSLGLAAETGLASQRLTIQGTVAFADGRLADAIDDFGDAAKAMTHSGYAALFRSMVAESMLHQGDVASAASLAQEARIAIGRSLGADSKYLAIPVKVTGLAALARGDVDTAIELLERARSLTSPCDLPELADIDYGLGVAWAVQGRDTEGAELQGSAQAAFEGFGDAGAARFERLKAVLNGGL